MGEIARVARKRWKIIGEAFADFQGRLVTVVFYFTIFVPFAVGARLFSDPLQIRKAPTVWHDRPPVGKTLDDARRQF